MGARVQQTKDKYLLNFAMMAGIVIAMVHYFPSQRGHGKESGRRNFQCKRWNICEQHSVPGPLFNSYGFGGYMIEVGL